jgi:hypothetical protein
MATTVDALVTALLKSMQTSQRAEEPYRHWILRHCLPQDAVQQLLELPFSAPCLGGVSGKRELHNATRQYLDVHTRQAFPICQAFCQALQDRHLLDRVANHFGASLGGSYLRVEYAQDTDGFWLEPHTDLGVKIFTMLLYLSKDAQHEALGTDIYNARRLHVGRAPFACNTAMVFVPGTATYHGFERRRIEGVRKSIIVNYVTSEWRAREQLAFPDEPIGDAAR